MELASVRARAQLLGPPKRRSPVEVVRHLLAVQAQDFASVPLALRARSRGLARADVHAAIDSGELVVSWLNRGTLHLVCREDHGWLHTLTAPTMVAMNARRLAQEGVPDPERGIRRIATALDDGPLLRREIAPLVRADGPALTHLLLAATLRGLIVRGPVRAGQQTFVLTRDHLGKSPRVDRDQALAALARRYFAGHAPASEADLAYWSGLPLRDVRAGMRSAGIRAEASGAEASGARAGGAEASGARAHGAERKRRLPPKLIPPFDPYIMGWRDRSFAVPDALAKRVMPGGGMFRAVVLVDGRAAGTWSRAGRRVQIDAPGVDGLDPEIADVERFLG